MVGWGQGENTHFFGGVICQVKKWLVRLSFFATLGGSHLTGWVLLKKRILFFDNVRGENVNLLKRLVIWWHAL